ncbi:UDP-N-acetylmuramoyl-tripeptide--D-alanyl-D-alanine ligase [Candidatus Peregrinibacteria bacterium]|nr:UDP-N-acetylmuramoyl-tripeptide--D-alanyl-D-alanine ligase [Candidatus Peregrinibacteria bacterium]
MKKIAQKFILFLLKKKAKAVLNSSAKIIGVTGSVGKTTTKNAIAHVLSSRYKVLASQEGFNTEIGILLTLLGEHESGFSSPMKWICILWRIFWKKLEIPEIIVLEYGVDAPGDMDKLLRIAQPSYGVLTKIAPIHLGESQFPNLEGIRDEKAKLLFSIPSGGMAILNHDDEKIREIFPQIHGKTCSFGTSPDADYTITEIKQYDDGISFHVKNDTDSATFRVPLLGIYHITVLLPAIILGKEFGISLQESTELLKNFSPPPGRGKILAGKNGSVLWDFSYNSSISSATAALQTLKEISAQRKLALLGNMNEIGKYSAEFHLELGKIAAKYADEIFFVGKEHEHFAEGVQGKKPLSIFENAVLAGEHLKNILTEGDFLLIKGSQNDVFLERAVAKILKNPEDAKFLCRQGKEWKKGIDKVVRNIVP